MALLHSVPLQGMLLNLLDAIREHIISRDGRRMKVAIEQLRADMDFDAVTISQVHHSIYMLQEAVSYEVQKRKSVMNCSTAASNPATTTNQTSLDVRTR